MQFQLVALLRSSYLSLRRRGLRRIGEEVKDAQLMNSNSSKSRTAGCSSRSNNSNSLNR